MYRGAALCSLAFALVEIWHFHSEKRIHGQLRGTFLFIGIYLSLFIPLVIASTLLEKRRNKKKSNAKDVS